MAMNNFGKSLALGLTFITMAAFSAQDSDDKALHKKMEKRLHNLCTSMSGDALLCSCIRAEVRENLSSNDYNFILESIYHMEAFDMEKLIATMDRYGINQENYAALSVQLQKVEDAAEEKCEAITAKVATP